MILAWRIVRCSFFSNINAAHSYIICFNVSSTWRICSYLFWRVKRLVIILTPRLRPIFIYTRETKKKKKNGSSPITELKVHLHFHFLHISSVYAVIQSFRIGKKWDSFNWDSGNYWKLGKLGIKWDESTKISSWMWSIVIYNSRNAASCLTINGN